METPVKKHKILIVDDEPSILNALVDKFTREGYIVLNAKDGEEGVEVALRAQPDIILLDIVMPNMDGLAMMKKVRAAGEWGKQVPIILLTNLSADEERIFESITRDEPAYYLVKSNWNLTDVVEKVREALKTK